MNASVSRSQILIGPSGAVMAMLGIGSASQLELLEINFRSWRTSLVGAALMNLTVAWVFKLIAPQSSLWWWACLGWGVYAALALVCLLYETIPTSRRVKRIWLTAAPLFSLVVGILWSSLAWWLPPTPGLQLLAALASVMVALGSAGASVSVGTLLAVCLPMLLVVPAAMFWHAHLPIAGVVMAALQLVIWRHGLALHRNMLATINQRREVEQLSQQLEMRQTQLQEAERERGVLHERQRLLRDMHDGVGASLVSALKMIEHGEIGSVELAQVLRECLDDLRLTIDSMDNVDEDLQTLLATVRYRLGDRMERAGIACQWDVDDVPGVPWLHAAQSLEVVRIVQEALANVLKHARSNHVRISLKYEDAQGAGRGIRLRLALRIQDNGVGFDPAAAPHGRGLRNMQHRASGLGGYVEIASSPGNGTSFCLYLPNCAFHPLHSSSEPKTP